MTAAPKDPWVGFLEAADQETRAATAILFDARCKRPSLAEIHIVRAWRALALGQSTATPSSSQNPQDVDLPQLDSTEREQWRADLAAMKKSAGNSFDDPTIPSALSTARLLRHCQYLERSIRNARRRLSQGANERAPGRRMRAVGLASFAVLALLTSELVASRPTGKWRGEYYANVDLRGTPVERIDDDLNFDWGDGAPLKGFPNDNFSAQWKTCLKLETPQKVRFLLGSDDGSRLFVDGKLLIDNWGPHDFRPIEGKTELQAGLHGLRVTYFDKGGGARVALWLGVGDELPRPIGPELLMLPGNGPGDEPRCAP
jgi:hypothetical protein